MKLLAIESSSELYTAALLIDDRILEREGAAGIPHSEIALPLIRDLLEEAGIGLAGLDGIAFGTGPGAFTGLRLAASLAQGLALGASLPVAAVCSLEALAAAAGAEAVYACSDARMEEVYCAAYRVGTDDLETVIAPQLSAPQAVPRPPGSGWLGCGSGFARHGAVLGARLGDALRRVDAAARPRAAAIARLAARSLRRGDALDPALALPLYVRDRVALTTAERVARGGKA